MKLFKRRLEQLEQNAGVEDEEPIVIVIVALDEHGNAVETGRTIIEKPTAEQCRRYSKPIVLDWGD